MRNGYTLKLVNKSVTTQQVGITVKGLGDAEFEIIGIGTSQPGGGLTLTSEAHGVDRYRMLVTVPAGDAADRDNLVVEIRDPGTGETIEAGAPFTRGDR